MKREGIIIAAVAIAAAAAGGAERYLWPLETERKLSSSFAEYRDGHYHAGIDLRTFGQIGLPCRAIDDGEAVRLRVQPGGYGKALYLRTSDGRTAVYAHLDGFCRPLDSLAYHWRLDRGRNSCDIEIPPGRFTFRRGDVVAYTGSSGSVHPHLHFELRGTDGAPLNPLEMFYDVPDDCPPILTGLAIVPRRWESIVDGSPLAVTRRFQLVGDNRYVVPDTFELDGEFGFGVRAYDQQTRGSYRMGWHETELLIDGAFAYRARNSRFDYARYNDVEIEYEARDGAAPGRYLALFRKRANSMGGREGVGAVTNGGPRDGVIALEPGLHRGEVTIRDAAGNAARGVFHFIMRPFGEGGSAPAEPAAAAPDGGAIALNFSHEVRAEGLYLRIKASQRLPCAPEAALLGDTTRAALRVLPLPPDEYVVLVPPERFLGGARTVRVRGVDMLGRAFERFNTLSLLAFETGSRDSIAAGESLAVWIQAPSVRGAAIVLADATARAAAAQPGLAPVGRPFTLDFAPEAFARYPLCSFAARRRAGLYRLNAEGRWRCVGVIAGETRAIEIRSPGTYAVMIDTEPPALRASALTRESPPSGYFKRLLFAVPVHEEGSGIDAESVSAFLDGRRVVCEYDGYRARFVVPLPHSHPRGQARLRIEAADRAGNVAAAEYSVMIE